MQGQVRVGILAVITTVSITVFAIALLIQHVGFARQTYSEAVASNVYLPYVRYDELPYQPEVTRGLSDRTASASFDAAMRHYRCGDYSGAVRGLKKVVRSAPEQAQAWLYLGVSYVMLRQGTAAVEALKQAELRSQNEMRIQARWYLVQAYLLTAQPQNALLVLTSIKDCPNNYTSGAAALELCLQRAVAQD